MLDSGLDVSEFSIAPLQDIVITVFDTVNVHHLIELLAADRLGLCVDRVGRTECRESGEVDLRPS